jgi:hypothetical protein
VGDEVEWMIIHEFPPVDPGVVSEIERLATVRWDWARFHSPGRRWSLKPVKSTSTCSPRCDKRSADHKNWRILIGSYYYQADLMAKLSFPVNAQLHLIPLIAHP